MDCYWILSEGPFHIPEVYLQFIFDETFSDKLDGESYYQSGDNKGTMRLRNIQLCDFFEDKS